MSSTDYAAIGRSYVALGRAEKLRETLQSHVDHYVAGSDIMDQLEQAARIPMDVLPVTVTNMTAIDKLVSVMSAQLEAMRVFATQRRLELAESEAAP